MTCLTRSTSPRACAARAMVAKANETASVARRIVDMVGPPGASLRSASPPESSDGRVQGPNPVRGRGLSSRGAMRDARRVIDDDIARARTLPAAFYRDPLLFERAREKVFARSWQQIDGAAALRRGAVLPFEFLPGCVEEPLLLARDADGTARCLSNVCTHRGNLVC